MSFRSKLSIFFTLFLLLISFGAFISWISMNNALKQQKELYVFKNELENLFNHLIITEHIYFINKNLKDSRDVFDTVDKINKELHNELKESRNKKQKDAAKIVLKSLQLYESSFNDFVRNNINKETMKSRMLRESTRLISNANELNQIERNSYQIILAINQTIQEEKNYMINEDDKNSKNINNNISLIIKRSNFIRQNTTNNNTKLKAFRISNYANTYITIFNKYVTANNNQKKSIQTMKQARTDFTDQFVKYIKISESVWKVKYIKMNIFTNSILVITIITGIITIFVLSNFITKPLNKLKLSIQQVVEGNLESKVEIKSNDEIGELGDYFNDMIQKLRKSFKNLEDYQLNLEEIIKLRTDNLEKEIEKRIKSEKNVKQALKDNEVLLYELQHRIKNNFNLIISLCELQKNFFKNKTIDEQFNKLQNRIVSISLIHTLLYKSKSISKISIQEYIDQLILSIKIGYNNLNKNISFDLSIDDLLLPLNKVKAVGIILNELITNSFKYAYSNKDDGIINIILKKDKKNVILEYYDNGVGLPKNFNNEKNHQSGLLIIKLLSKELKSSFEITEKNGFNFKLTFKEGTKK